MHPIRRRRLILLLMILSGIACAALFSLYALKQNINLFFTPTQVLKGEAPHTHTFRVGGLVRNGSVQRDSKTLKVRFVLTDNVSDLIVNYTGILPDLFREGQGIVAEGTLLPDGTFVADQVLAKHDERYMPPVVKEALLHPEGASPK